MKTTAKVAIAIAPMLIALASVPANAGPVRNGYVYDDCENNKGGFECVEVKVSFVDFDSDQGWGSTSSSSTLLDRVELYLDGDCTTTNGKRLTKSFTLNVASAKTRFVRSWTVPKNCSYKVHARHHRSIGKDSIYRFSLGKQTKDQCHAYNIKTGKLLTGTALIQSGAITPEAACE